MANNELLEQVMQYIEANPDKLNMETWAPSCGTECCFAGHVALLTGCTYNHEHNYNGRTMVGPDGELVDIPRWAANQLALTPYEKDALFYAFGGAARVRRVVDAIKAGEVTDYDWEEVTDYDLGV